MAESKILDLLRAVQVARYPNMSASFIGKRRSQEKSPAFSKIVARVFHRHVVINDWLEARVCEVSSHGK